MRADVEAGERAYSIDAAGITAGPIVRRLQERIVLDRFPDEFRITPGLLELSDVFAVAVDDPHRPVVALPAALRGHQAHEQAGKLTEDARLLVVLIEEAFEEGKSGANGCDVLGDA